MKKLVLLLIAALLLTGTGGGLNAALAQELEPEDTPAAAETAWLGVSIAQVPSIMRDALGQDGVIIVKVCPDSPAASSAFTQAGVLHGQIAGCR